MAQALSACGGGGGSARGRGRGNRFNVDQCMASSIPTCPRRHFRLGCQAMAADQQQSDCLGRGAMMGRRGGGERCMGGGGRRGGRGQCLTEEMVQEVDMVRGEDVQPCQRGRGRRRMMWSTAPMEEEQDMMMMMKGLGNCSLPLRFEERPEAYTLSCTLPAGVVSREEVEVMVEDDDYLVLEVQTEKERLLRRLPLPFDCDPDSIEAIFRPSQDTGNNILLITIAKVIEEEEEEVPSIMKRKVVEIK